MRNVRYPLKKYLGILIIGLFISCGFYWKYLGEIKTAKQSYTKEKDAEVASVLKTVDEKLRYVYQTIRTMSLIPGVRSLDRYGKNFDRNAKISLQQLYNNASMNVKLSEVYL